MTSNPKTSKHRLAGSHSSSAPPAPFALTAQWYVCARCGCIGNIVFTTSASIYLRSARTSHPRSMKSSNVALSVRFVPSSSYS